MQYRFIIYICALFLLFPSNIYSVTYKNILDKNYQAEHKTLYTFEIDNETLKILNQSCVLTNNLRKEEKYLLNLYLNNLPASIQSINNRQKIINELIILLNKSKTNTDFLNYNSSPIEIFTNLSNENLDNNQIVEIINNLISFFKKYTKLLAFIKSNISLYSLFQNEIHLFEFVTSNKFNDEMLNEAISFIKKGKKIKDQILFNKNYKLKYIYAIYRNFDIISKFIYDYYKISLFIKISKNIISSNHKYTYVILMQNVSQNYFIKIKEMVKTLQNADIIAILNNGNTFTFRHFYKTANNAKYPVTKIKENLIFGILIGITFDL